MEILDSEIEPRLRLELKGFKPKYFVDLAEKLLVDKKGNPKFTHRRIREALNLNFIYMNGKRTQELQDFIAYHGGFKDPEALWTTHYSKPNGINGKQQY